MRASSLSIQKGTSFDKRLLFCVRYRGRPVEHKVGERVASNDDTQSVNSSIPSLPPFFFLQLPISQSNGDNRTQLLLRLRARSRGELRARDSEKR